MKRIIGILFIAFVAACSSPAQGIDLPADSVASLLCKTWDLDYLMANDSKLDKIPDGSHIRYEFKNDQSFVMTNIDLDDKANGTWTYDSKNKVINLQMEGASKSKIISLTKDQLTIVAETPDKTMEIKMVYKVKE